MKKVPNTVYGIPLKDCVLLYDNRNELFDADCDSQKVLVYKLDHVAIGSRQTRTITSVKIQPKKGR